MASILDQLRAYAVSVIRGRIAARRNPDTAHQIRRLIDYPPPEPDYTPGSRGAIGGIGGSAVRPKPITVFVPGGYNVWMCWPTANDLGGSPAAGYGWGDPFTGANALWGTVQTSFATNAGIAVEANLNGGIDAYDSDAIAFPRNWVDDNPDSKVVISWHVLNSGTSYIAAGGELVLTRTKQVYAVCLKDMLDADDDEQRFMVWIEAGSSMFANQIVYDDETTFHFTGPLYRWDINTSGSFFWTYSSWVEFSQDATHFVNNRLSLIYAGGTYTYQSNCYESDALPTSVLTTGTDVECTTLAADSDAKEDFTYTLVENIPEHGYPEIDINDEVLVEGKIHVKSQYKDSVRQDAFVTMKFTDVYPCWPLGGSGPDDENAAELVSLFEVFADGESVADFSETRSLFKRWCEFDRQADTFDYHLEINPAFTNRYAIDLRYDFIPFIEMGVQDNVVYDSSSYSGSCGTMSYTALAYTQYDSPTYYTPDCKLVWGDKSISLSGDYGGYYCGMSAFGDATPEWDLDDEDNAKDFLVEQAFNFALSFKNSLGYTWRTHDAYGTNELTGTIYLHTCAINEDYVLVNFGGEEQNTGETLFVNYINDTIDLTDRFSPPSTDGFSILYRTVVAPTVVDNSFGFMRQPDE